MAERISFFDNMSPPFGAFFIRQQGEFLAIMGASGSGKSTLLHLLGALDVPSEGNVYFEGKDIFAQGAAQRNKYRNETFGFVFQFYHLLPELRVLENVLLPQMVRTPMLRWIKERKAAKAAAMEMLNTMGLEHRIKHRPNELSGGEQQRVAIARALVNRPPVLLADEPTGNLDKKTGKEILTIFKQLNEQGQTIVMVTHDHWVASQADRVMTLADGRIRKTDDSETAAEAAV